MLFRGARSVSWLVALIVIVACTSCANSAVAEISCKDVEYGNPKYQDEMQELARQARLPGNDWNRYHATVVTDLCTGNSKDVDKMVDDGSVKAQEAEAIASVLGKSYKTKPRSAIGISYQAAKTKLLEMGACSACADNIAQHYSRNPGSPCGTLAKQALDGDQDAVSKLLAFPDFCKWTYE